MFNSLWTHYTQLWDRLTKKKKVLKECQEKLAKTEEDLLEMKKKHFPEKCQFPNLNCNINCSSCHSNPPMF